MDEIDKKKYSYDRFGSKGMRVGQAALDILSKEQPIYTVQDVLDSWGPDFAKELEKTVEKAAPKYKAPFYVFVLTHKPMFATNVIRNWFIDRKTAPHALDMVQQYANHTKTLYWVDAAKGRIEICWSLPGIQDINSILKKPDQYDPTLVSWIISAFQGLLQKDEYQFA